MAKVVETLEPPPKEAASGRVLPGQQTTGASKIVPVNNDRLSMYGKTLNKLYQQMARVINGQLGFGDGSQLDNMAGAWANVTSSVATGTEFAITHNLGYVPIGYLVFTQNKPASFYLGSSAWTTTQIFLKADNSSVAVKLFIL